MRLSADFTVIPDIYAKHAPQSHTVDGIPSVSFPFYIEGLRPQAQYLHWEFVDDDAIAVCGFQWIHWGVANVPVDALMFDFNDSRALHIPEDFSNSMPALIPEAAQGRTSSASPLVGRTPSPVHMRYNGPQPPNADHDYMLTVVATSKPLPDLAEGFYLNELRNALRHSDSVVDSGVIWLTGRA